MDDDERFKQMISYFQKEKGDVTRYCYWDESRCEKLMPLFYEAWKKKNFYRDLMYLALDKEAA